MGHAYVYHTYTSIYVYVHTYIYIHIHCISMSYRMYPYLSIYYHTVHLPQWVYKITVSVFSYLAICTTPRYARTVPNAFYTVSILSFRLNYFSYRHIFAKTIFETTLKTKFLENETSPTEMQMKKNNGTPVLRYTKYHFCLAIPKFI